MARQGGGAARGRGLFVGWIWLVALLLVVVPPAGPVQANGHPLGGSQGPGGPQDPPAPAPLSIPGDAYETPPGASIDYLPASSSVTPAGQFTLSIPIDTPPARGMGPSLSFAYASTAATGLLGVGWSVAGLSTITRCRNTIATGGANRAVRYEGTDALCLDDQPLVLVQKIEGDTGCKEYRTERDVFARILACGDTVSGPAWFRVWTKAGQILFYEGIHHFTTEEGLFDTTDVIVAWPLRDAQDRSGNLVRYSYEVHQDDGEVGFHYRPKEIESTRKAAEPPFVAEEAGLRKVVFEYEDRPDPSDPYFGGIRYGMPERLAAVSLIAPNPEVPEVVARYELSYTQSPVTGRSLLTQIRRCDGGEGADKACLWAKQFSWWHADKPDFEDHAVFSDHVLSPEVAFFVVLDANGDGKDDLLAQTGYANVADEEAPIWLFRGSSDPADHGFLPPVLVNDPGSGGVAFHHVHLATSRAADLDADGTMELLAFMKPPLDVPPYTTGFQVFRWNEDTLALEPVGEFLEADGPSAAQLVDLEGDGLIDLLRAEPAPAIPARWLLHRNVGGALSSAEVTDLWAFEPARAAALDVDGDGRGELFTVDPVEGLDPAHLVPLGVDDAGKFGALDEDWVVPSQGPQSLLPVFADVNGDGLKDALYLWDDPKRVRFCTGKHFLPAAALDPLGGAGLPGQVLDPSVTDGGVRVADFDGDGREDLLSLEAVNEVGQQVMRLFLSRPGGFETRDLDRLSGYKAPYAGWTTTQLGDFNGDGWLDVVHMPTITEQTGGGTTTGQVAIKVLLQKAIAPENGMADLLFEVKDEHAPAPRESVFYTTAWSRDSTSSPVATNCAHPQLCLRRGFPVVRMVGTRSLDPDVTRWMFYDYEDPRADPAGPRLPRVRRRACVGPAAPRGDRGHVRPHDPHRRALPLRGATEADPTHRAAARSAHGRE